MAKKPNLPNPFADPNRFKIKAVWRLEKMITAGTDRLKEGHSTPLQQLRVYKQERGSKVLLYTEDLFTFYQNLSTSAKDMIMYIASRMRFNKDYLELEEDRYCETMNVSRSTFFSAKASINDIIILPRAKRNNTYWINPKYMFRGHRIEAYPDCVIMENTHPFEKYMIEMPEDATEDFED